MKTLRLIGMALFAVLMCVNFASCSNDVIPDELNQEEYVTVSLDCVGEYLEVTNSPLSRTGESDVYYIQVYSDGIPYANGKFNDLTAATIKLLHGAKYKFKVVIAVGTQISPYTDNKYNYTNNDSFYFIESSVVEREGFYGELDNYTPQKGESVEIRTKRVSYGANFIAEGLNEGALDIIVSNMNIVNKKRYTVNLTPEIPTSNKIYSFYDIYAAWEGVRTATGETDSTGAPIYEDKDYTCVKNLNISWKKGTTETIPLGSYDVTFKRNVRTTIRIKVENPTYNNGITITREDTAISDDENDYNIEGGEITEVPVNSES